MVNQVAVKLGTKVHGIVEDLELLGLENPFNTVFCDLQHNQYFSLLWVVFVISQIPKIVLFGNCVEKSPIKRFQNRTDGLPMVYGLVTIFKQYNTAVTRTFLDYFTVYLKFAVEAVVR